MLRSYAIGASIAVFVASYLATSTAIDYVQPVHRRPTLYVTFDPVFVVPPTPPMPDAGVAIAVFLGWLAGVPYGIYLFERRNLNRSLTEILQEKLRNVRY